MVDTMLFRERCSFMLPSNVASGNVNAKFENGILHIKIPKQEKETSKKIEIKS